MPAIPLPSQFGADVFFANALQQAGKARTHLMQQQTTFFEQMLQ